jgi:hypothetical protein
MMTSSIRRGLVLSIGLACAALAAKAQNAAQLVPSGSRAAVLYCIASDCPISNRSLPEMKRLERELSACGVSFWFVYPNVTETAAGLSARGRLTARRRI